MAHLFFDSTSASPVNGGVSTGGRRRVNGNKLQVPVARIPKIVELSRGDEYRVVSSGRLCTTIKDHFSFAFDNEQDLIAMVVCLFAQLPLGGILITANSLKAPV